MKIAFSRDTAEMLEALSDAEIGLLVRAACGYVFHDREPSMPDRLDVTWRVIKARLERHLKPGEIRAAKMRAAKAAKRNARKAGA